MCHFSMLYWPGNDWGRYEKTQKKIRYARAASSGFFKFEFCSEKTGRLMTKRQWVCRHYRGIIYVEALVTISNVVPLGITGPSKLRQKVMD